MELSRLRAGEALAGLSALALLVLLAFDWFRPEPEVLKDTRLPGVLDGLADQNVDRFLSRVAENGWTGLGWLLVLLLVATAVAGLALAVLTVGTHASVAPAVSAAVITTALGAFTLVLLLVRLTLAQPDLDLGFEDADVDVLLPAVLGLLAVAGIVAGGWRSMQDERTDAPYNAPPDLEPRPIPELREPLGSGRPQSQ